MGLFENIKKFADEVTDTDSCSLGDQVSDSALKKQLQAIWGYKKKKGEL